MVSVSEGHWQGGKRGGPGTSWGAGSHREPQGRQVKKQRGGRMHSAKTVGSKYLLENTNSFLDRKNSLGRGGAIVVMCILVIICYTSRREGRKKTNICQASVNY